MAVSALTKLTGTTIEVTEDKYEKLVREREQLRILKNFIKQENVLVKSEVETLIKAMEASNE